MAKRPKSVEIRSYQVGFGDCFLISFVYGVTDKRHVLVDFGTTALPKRASRTTRARDHMPRVADDIRTVSGGRLTAVVATHRHEDHISGFATDASSGESGLVIRGLRPKVVLQPWTEDPDAARDATHATRDSSRSPRGFVANLAAMHDVAAAIVALTAHPPAWMSAALVKELHFLGMDNIANRSAVENLIAMGQASGAKAVWAHHGSKSGLERLIPGVKVHVLGPPDLTQTQSIRKQRPEHPDEFWNLLAGPSQLRSSLPLANGLSRRKPRRRRSTPPEARWFRDRLVRERGQQLLEIVRALDSQMNNTSLILLFEVFGAKLLFPGDAQFENWSYALAEAPDRDATRRLLAGVDVYKVGHHGSTNATPRLLLWDKFKHRTSIGGRGMTTLLSTLPGKHGKPANKSEVPRRPLLQALRSDTTLIDTDALRFGVQTTDLCNCIEILPGTNGAAPSVRVLQP